MKGSIVATGFVIILFGFVLWIAIGWPIEITFLIGLINIVLGIATPRSPGLNLQPESTGQLKLIVDKARSKTGTYQLIFSDTKLIMKKLAGNGAAMAFALVFALIGGLIGGATGYSVQEYMVERRRRKIQQENTLTTITRGDMEIPYESMSQLELSKNKLRMNLGTGPMMLAMSKKYPPMISSKLREIIPGRCWAPQLPISA